MKSIFTFIFLSFYLTVFSQEYFQHNLYETHSLEVFNHNDSLFHIHSDRHHSSINKINLETAKLKRQEFTYGSHRSKLKYHSNDSIEVCLSKLFNGDVYSHGFKYFRFQNDKEKIVDEYYYVTDVIEDFVYFDENRYLLNAQENENFNMFLYDVESKDKIEWYQEEHEPEAKIFRKNNTEYYFTEKNGTYLGTYDDQYSQIEFEKILEYGSSDAKWISNTNSFGFIYNQAFYITDVDSGITSKWIDGITHSLKNYYFNQDALYIITKTNEIIKYIPEISPQLVFSHNNTNTTVGINLQTLFVENDSLIIGASTEKIKSPLIMKVKENESININRPQLEINDAICYLKDSANNIVIYDCSYYVKNIGNKPINNFSIYSHPQAYFGSYIYKHNQFNEEPLMPNESMLLEIHSKTFNYLVPEIFYIEGADNLLLGELATTNVKQVVSTENVKNEPSISIFPNPSNDYFYIKGAASNSQYTLINSKGQILKKGELIDDRIEIADLENGTYFIQLWHKNKMTILEGIKV